jgi:hypothetical protein
MAKRKARSQVGSLTLNHKKSRIDLTPMRASGMRHTIRKLLKFRCLKWACMTHLDIYNTSYGKKKAKSQIGSLTPDHKTLGIDSTPVHASAVQYTIGKFLMRATTLLQTSSRSKVWTHNYSLAKLREFKCYGPGYKQEENYKTRQDMTILENWEFYWSIN